MQNNEGAISEENGLARNSSKESATPDDAQAENGKNAVEETKNEAKKGETREVIISEVIATALDDMLKEEEESQKMVDALLGGCLDLVCTYSEGYKTRQPLYSCKTCTAKTSQIAGICYGCAENCHEDHDLVELYTKRNFCCDCGNSKFTEKCKLYEEKKPLNGRNQYNDNFKGIFCVCKKPYPPPVLEAGMIEGKEEEAPCLEDMIQCPICEDWFHPTHVLSDPEELAKLDPNENELFDLICPGCVQKLPWLVNYHGNLGQQQNGEGEDICKLEMLKSAKVEGNKQPKCFCLPLGWREQLCRCKKCQNLYEDLNCSFLLEHEDTIDYFEQQNREKIAQRREEEENKNKGTNEGNALEQREFAFHVKNGIEQMERHCVDFFAKRTTEKRGAPITEEDVKECFMELTEKRQRLMAEGEEEEKAAWTE